MTKTESAIREIKLYSIEACQQLLLCQKEPGVRLAIPNTKNLIMVGTQEWIAKNVPGVEAMVVEPVAWMHEDGRVIAAATMAGARKDGGAMLSSLRGYTIPLFAATTQASTAQAEPSVWISVDERLPELHQTVALLDEKRWMNTGSSDHNVNWHGSGYLCEFGGKYWSIFGEMRSQCLDAVTHWMPLPAAPSALRAGDTGGAQ